MEVTRSNYAEVLPEIKEAIDKCVFLSFDCEFTGLYSGYHINSFDPPNEWYNKLIEHSQDFLILQLGLSIFRYDDVKEKMVVQSYNFFVFPHRLHEDSPNVRFMCESASIEFLLKNGFDFNKAFQEGIPYLNAKTKEELEIALEERLNFRYHRSMNHIDSVTVTSAISYLEEFINSDENESFLPACTKHVCSLIKHNSLQKFGIDLVDLEILPMDSNGLYVVKATKATSFTEKQEEHRRIINKHMGITDLILYISESRKPIVGHNLFLDLSHILRQFLTSLPRSLGEYKEIVNTLFPIIYDTKYIVSADPINSFVKKTMLSTMLETLKKIPFGLLDIESTSAYNLTQPREHEAGYDSFITGHCFLAMWQFMKNRDHSFQKVPLTESMDVLKNYANKVLLVRHYNRLSFINFGGEDVHPVRQYVIYVKYPSEWQDYQIHQIFETLPNVRFEKIDNTSCYVGLPSCKLVPEAIRLGRKNPLFVVMTYDEYEASKANNSVDSSNNTPQPSTSGMSSQKSDKPSYKKQSSTSNIRKDQQTTSRQDQDGVKPLLSNTRKRKINKAFDEDSSWE